jgi:hypothetical protein
LKVCACNDLFVSTVVLPFFIFQGVMSRLLESRRLVLVLDLDHTLVNSVKFNEVDQEWEYKLEQTVAEQVNRLNSRSLEL